jgi:excisionase family DNA binding protein
VSDRLLLDAEGAAELLSMSRASVERLAASGDLKSVRVRGMRRYRKLDLEAFVEDLGENDAASRPRLTALADDQVRRGHRRR